MFRLTRGPAVWDDLFCVRGFGLNEKVDRSFIKVLHVAIRSLGFILGVLRNDRKVLSREMI